MAILTVGSGKQFTTLSAAIAASHDGDTLQVQAGTYLNDFATIGTKISIVGVGGMVSLVATQAPPNGKAILTTETDITLDHIEFSGAAVADGNGAGIRYEGGNLTITNSYFHNNQDGILAGAVPGGTITIDHSEFAFNGAGDGYTHNIYVNEIAKLQITNSYLHDANLGHELKSRADVTIVTNSRIYDNNSTASYSIDMSNGGAGTIQNNVIEQGPNSQNPAIIAFAEETGSPYANSQLTVSNNTILNDKSGSATAIWNNASGVTAQISGNSFYGLTANQIAQGANTQSGDVFLTSEPTLDTSHPWSSSGSGTGTGATGTGTGTSSPPANTALTNITALYSAAFDRQPDPGGLTYWENAYGHGVALPAISATFAASPEFLARYGTLNVSGFVTQLYQNVLDRAPDAGGLSYWTDTLQHGISRGDVLLGFAMSGENLTKLTAEGWLFG